jgi:hypothetical protein
MLFFLILELLSVADGWPTVSVSGGREPRKGPREQLEDVGDLLEPPSGIEPETC